NPLGFAGRAAIGTIPPVDLLRHVETIRPVTTNVAGALHAFRDVTVRPHKEVIVQAEGQNRCMPASARQVADPQRRARYTCDRRGCSGRCYARIFAQRVEKTVLLATGMKPAKESRLPSRKRKAGHSGSEVELQSELNVARVLHLARNLPEGCRSPDVAARRPPACVVERV